MNATDSKPEHILDSSLEVFCRYGFQKTSMLDIAQAAGMSRAALYLHFKNKEDVFRSGSLRAHATVMQAIEAEFAGEGSTLNRIESALRSYFTGLMEQIGESPHGAELFDANAELIGDVARDARTRLVNLIATALDDADKSGELVLAGVDATSEQLAALLVANLDGLKHGRSGALTVKEGIALNVRVIRAAVERTR